MDRKQIMHYYRIGKIFGYSNCCIKYFCDNTGSNKILNFEDWPYIIQIACNKLRQNNKSFIPCPFCAKQINTNVKAYLKSKPTIMKDGSINLSKSI